MNRGAESQAFQMAAKDRVVEPTIYIASAEGLRNVPLDQDNKRRIKTIDCQKMVNYVPKIDENLFPSASLGNQDILMKMHSYLRNLVIISLIMILPVATQSLAWADMGNQADLVAGEKKGIQTQDCSWSGTIGNAGGAAAGGFIGVVLFFGIRLLLEWWAVRPKIIHTYQCAAPQNQGQQNEGQGELMHHHGKRVDNLQEMAALRVTGPVWEWNTERCGRPPRLGSVIYGPYSTDFEEPGLYSATFRIRGNGLPDAQEIDSKNDFVLLELDVNQTRNQLGPSGLVPVQEQFARKYVRASQLAKGGWQNFELTFSSDGRGIWEYRVLVNDGEDGKENNMASYGQNVKLYFDTVVIKRIHKVKMPW